jgi:hypothetical protein
VKGAIVPIDIATRRAAIDEFGRLDALLREQKSVRDRHEQLRKQITGWYEDAPADEEHTAEGETFSVVVSRRGMKRHVVSMKALKDRLGLKRFLELCSFSLEVIDRVIAKDEHDGLIEQTQSGPRRLTAIKKLEAAA